MALKGSRYAMWHHLGQCFWSDEGQDLTEYALLLAFVVLGASGIFVVNGRSLVTIWTAANAIVNQAASRASS